MTEEQRDELLLSLADNMKKDEERDKLLASLVDNMKKDEERDKLLASLVDNMKKDEERDKLLASLVNDVKELKVESVRQRENLARLEFTLLDKIEALFDVKEINSDKFKEHDNELKSINRILGNHNRRLLNLESKAN